MLNQEMKITRDILICQLQNQPFKNHVKTSTKLDYQCKEDKPKSIIHLIIDNYYTNGKSIEK